MKVNEKMKEECSGIWWAPVGRGRKNEDLSDCIRLFFVFFFSFFVHH